jgi:hypothetical protein
MSKSDSVGVVALGLIVGALGAVLVACALWAWLGWPGAVAFLGTIAMLLAVAIVRVKT